MNMKINRNIIPGVGGSMNNKLTAMGVTTCEDVQKLQASKLQQEFGKKLGLVLQRYLLFINYRKNKCS